MKTSLRSHDCGELGAGQTGQEVFLCGWVHSIRHHGGVLFVDLRDRSGLVQVVAHPDHPEAFKAAEGLGSEYAVRVKGQVQRRPKGTENPKISTGEVEVYALEISVLNPSVPLPFEISEHVNVSEEVRLSHRYLDLRRSRMQKNLRLRHELIRSIREYLNEREFLEIETPILTKSTPEGARDFLVPSRLSPGKFYALPQSPQIFKQILMVSGMERYYQIARCFRDEDLRADRQPEFTQLDLEMSFIQEEDILQLLEGLLQHVFKKVLNVEVPLPIRRLSYEEAMLKYGSDKPDLRFGLEIKDVTGLFNGTKFQVFAKAPRVRTLHVEGKLYNPSRSEIDSLTQQVTALGAKGLAWIKWEEKGPNSPIVKFFSQEEMQKLKEALGPNPGDTSFFIADSQKIAEKALGALRLEIAKRSSSIQKEGVQLLWVVDFPLFEWSEEEKRWVSMHHPFTSPTPESLELLSQKEIPFSSLKARAYDIVFNGVEIGGGSIRIHDTQIQEKVFELLGISSEQAQRRFGFLLEALRYGAPPHGGIALGLDRIAALLCGEESIREVIAFPKTQKGADPLSEAPSEVDPQQLKELSIKCL